MKDTRNVYLMNMEAKGGRVKPNNKIVKCIASLKDVESVYEIGFGFGHTLCAVADKVNTAGGIDFNPMFLSYGSNFTNIKSLNVTINHDISQWEPYENEHDVVYIDNWVHNLSSSDRDSLLAKAYKMAKKYVVLCLDYNGQVDYDTIENDHALVIKVAPTKPTDEKPTLKNLLSGEKKLKPTAPLESRSLTADQFSTKDAKND